MSERWKKQNYACQTQTRVIYKSSGTLPEVFLGEMPTSANGQPYITAMVVTKMVTFEVHTYADVRGIATTDIAKSNSRTPADSLSRAYKISTQHANHTKRYTRGMHPFCKASLGGSGRSMRMRFIHTRSASTSRDLFTSLFYFFELRVRKSKGCRIS